jgi:hypothetical protein
LARSITGCHKVQEQTRQEGLRGDQRNSNTSFILTMYPFSCSVVGLALTSLCSRITSDPLKAYVGISYVWLWLKRYADHTTSFCPEVTLYRIRHGHEKSVSTPLRRLRFIRILRDCPMEVRGGIINLVSMMVRGKILLAVLRLLKKPGTILEVEISAGGSIWFFDFQSISLSQDQ